MSNKELLRCPFCGGEAVILQHKDGIDDWIVLCKKCGCQTDFMFTEYEAIHAWNTRNYPVFPDSSNSSEISNTSKVNQSVVENGNDECCEKSCKDENATLKPLVPKWQDKRASWHYLEVFIMQDVKIVFEIKYDTDYYSPFLYTLKAFFTVWDSECDYEEEIGYFNDLEEAKAKANECIREIGEKLVYFAENIRTNDELES